VLQNRLGVLGFLAVSWGLGTTPQKALAGPAGEEKKVTVEIVLATEHVPEGLKPGPGSI
jgi:hypothetical protein